MSRAVQHGLPDHGEFWIRGLDEAPRHISVTAFPMVGQHGRHLGFGGHLLGGPRSDEDRPVGRTRGPPVSEAGTTRYGGNTSCVEVCSDDPTHVVVLDAGTGVCSLGTSWDPSILACRCPPQPPPHRPHPRAGILQRPVPGRARSPHLGPGFDHAVPSGATEQVPFAAAVPGAAPGSAVPADPPRRAARAVRNTGVRRSVHASVPPGPYGRVPVGGPARIAGVRPRPRTGARCPGIPQSATLDLRPRSCRRGRRLDPRCPIRRPRVRHPGGLGSRLGGSRLCLRWSGRRSPSDPLSPRPAPRRLETRRPLRSDLCPLRDAVRRYTGPGG